MASDPPPLAVDPENQLRVIVRRLGGELYRGGSAALVPGPGHSLQDRSLSLRLTPEGRVLWWSHAGDDPREVCRHLGLSGVGSGGAPRGEDERQRRMRLESERLEHERKRTFCGWIWRGTVSATGSPVESYLRSRGIDGPIPPVIRSHASAPLAYPTSWRPRSPTFPAMVALATARDGIGCGLHVTALAADGSGKAALSQPRRMFGQMAGAAVQLSPMSADGELGLAEGIETALSFHALTGTPTWAALSTSGVRRFELPTGVVRLVIAADGDEAGRRAAEALARRAALHCAVVVMPAPDGMDWADVLRGAVR